MNGIYLKAAIRNILKNRLYSAISITGLALGIAVSLMIALFIRFETGFEKQFPHHERTYRVNWENLGTGARFATFFNPVTPLLAENLPNDIEAFTRITHSRHLLRNETDRFVETISLVDANFFAFFPLGSISGDPATALEDMKAAVLTETAATKIFGTSNAIGQTFSLDGNFDFTVAAIIPDLPANTHLTGNIFLNVENTPALWGWENMWESMRSDQLYHYVRLVKGVSQAQAEADILQFAERMQEGTSSNIAIPLQPITDIHFNPDLQNETASMDPMTKIVKPFRQRTDVYVFTSVALLTFLIAAFNFMNMQVVQTTNRLKEVGVRKVLGAHRRHIITQFLLEACLLAVVSMLFALMLAEVSLPWFAGLVEAPLASVSFFSPDMLVILLVATFAAAAVAGIYPALVISRHLPSVALRGDAIKGSSGTKVRSTLIVAQFAIAIGLISASGVVNGQIDYALAKSLGFDGERVVVASVPFSKREAYSSIKAQLESNSAVESISGGSVLPAGDLADGMGFKIVNDGVEQDIATRLVYTDSDYFRALDMNIVAGRAYSEDFPGDAVRFPTPDNPTAKAGLILNEKALKQAGFENPQDAVGKSLWVEYQRRGTQFRVDFTLVGVSEDAHYSSIRSEIAPISYFYMPGNIRQLMIKAKPGELETVRAAVAEAWSNSISDYPPAVTVLGETYNDLYAGENRTFGLFIGFAGLAVLIACMGLWGLTSYIVERRTKEIGIRKVMGATVRHIVGMLTWDFSKLVIVANLIAWPAAWLIMSDWLSSFAYQSEISILAFLIAAVAAFLMALVTTSSRAYVAAQLNPAQTLRTE